MRLGVSPSHTPQKIVAEKNKKPAAIVSGRKTTTTVLACGNAIGNSIPPFLIYKGKRFDEQLKVGSTPGTRVTLSDSGWSNSVLFKEYLTNHFSKYTSR